MHRSCRTHYSSRAFHTTTAASPCIELLTRRTHCHIRAFHATTAAPPCIELIRWHTVPFTQVQQPRRVSAQQLAVHTAIPQTNLYRSLPDQVTYQIPATRGRRGGGLFAGRLFQERGTGSTKLPISLYQNLAQCGAQIEYTTTNPNLSCSFLSDQDYCAGSV